MSKLRQIALVLGMHRSGTSALAALISRLGFDLGKNIMPANEFNAKGYYENERLVNFHSEALAHLGSSWHDLRILPDKLFEPRWIDDAALKLASILRAEFGNARRIVVKDPRACRLMPIWQRLSLERGIDLRFVLIGRHPLEVCYSLNHRDGFSRRKSLLLWLQYNLAAERHSRSHPRLILRYADLVDEPEAQVRELASFLEVTGGPKLHEAAAIVDSSLAHHRAVTGLLCDHPELSQWTKSVWRTLFHHDLAKVPAQKRLDRIFKNLTKGLSIFPEEAIGQGEQEAAELRRALSRVDQEHTNLKERYQEQNQNLQNVMQQRDEFRKQAEAAAKAIQSAKAEVDRLVRENATLFSAEKIRTEVLHQEQEKLAAFQRQFIELELKNENLGSEVKRLQLSKRNLREELFRQNADLSAAQDKIKQLELGRIELQDQLTSVQADLETSRKEVGRLQRVETSLQAHLSRDGQEIKTTRGQLNRAEISAQLSEQRKDLLEKALERTAAQLVQRNAQVEALRREMETLRHDWSALPVRQRLKRFARPLVDDPSELAQVNALTPNVWNLSIAGFNLGLAVFPDVGNPDVFFIEGWVIPKDKGPYTPAIQLVSESGVRFKAKCGRQRIDVPLLFPNRAEAAHCGFAFLKLTGVSGEMCRVEIRNSQGGWIALALVDFSALGWRHLLDIYEIVESRFFDAFWYAKHSGLPNLNRLVLISHYLREGAARGLFPNPLFDPAYYLETNPDLCATGENPLLAYLRARKEGKVRQPNRWFDPIWYLAKNKDVAAAGLDPFLHYLDHGRAEKRNPGPHFDAAGYLRLYPDVERDGTLDALSHFLHYGEAEGRHVPDPQAIGWIYRTSAPSAGKLNVLLVGHALGDKLFGGERSLLELIRLIDRDRFNIFCSFPAIYRPFVERIKPFVAGVAVFPYQWWRGSATWTDGFDSQFEDILRSCAIGLVHVNSIMLRDPLIAAKRLGIPSILHLREVIALDQELAEHIGLPAEQIVEEVAGRSDFIIANSRFTQAQYQNSERSFVLYNTADEVAFDMPLRQRTGELRVAMLSSNIPKKGLEDFFAIARLALEQGNYLEFWLIGPETDWIKRHFRVHGGCPTNVHFAGYAEDPRDVLREVDVIINLSNFAESFGRTVAEGMLARRPAVVYEYGALPEVVRDGVDGFVVPFRDVNAALQRLNVLAHDSALLERMAESARTRALGNFSRRVGAKILNGIYDTILQGAVTPSAKSALVPGSEHVPTLARRKLRIGYFMWHFPVPSETFVLNELRQFVQSGYDVRVFCCQSPYKDFKPDFPIQWQQVRSPEDLAEKIQESERDIMHSHFVFPTVTQFLWPACESAHVPFTFIAHAQDIFRHENASRNRLSEITRSPYCRNVFAPGTYHRDLFVRSGVPQEKIIINPQAILFDAYEAQPIASRLERPRMSICAIHRFVEKKGLHNAICAASQLAVEGVSLHLYGYGPLEQSYRELVAELGLDNVTFPGPITDRDHMMAVFREHDLFLCPCIRAEDGDMDGIPTILLEAMASHVPVVASRVSSILDLVRDGLTGYLCEPGDPHSLAQAILRFYRSSTAGVQSIIENGREIVRRRFDIAKNSRTLLRIWCGEGLDVVLVTFNETAHVREVIERLYRYTKTPFRLYIVDNGSAADTLEYLNTVEAEHDNVRVLPQTRNLFVGPGLNKGLDAGTAPFAVYLCSREGYILSDGWDQAILNYMEDHPAVGLAGTLGYSPSYLTGADYIAQLEPFPRFRRPEFAAKNPDRLFRHVQGGLFVVRRAMYEAIGGFSETVPHNHTDVEYSYYVESCGWELGQIQEILALYNKTRPDLTARLTESVSAVHPGSPMLSPLLDSVVGLESNFCNVCGSLVSFKNEISDRVCPVCAATSFHRSIYRFLAESTLTYRRLLSLFAGEFDCLLPKWKEMFGGRVIDYFPLLSEVAENHRIDHRSDQLDVVVLRVPDAILDFPRALVAECCRILKPGGTLLYFQRYGVDSILDATEPKGIALRNADCVVSQLEGAGLQVDSRARYASAVVDYSEHVIFVCAKSLPR